MRKILPLFLIFYLLSGSTTVLAVKGKDVLKLQDMLNKKLQKANTLEQTFLTELQQPNVLLLADKFGSFKSAIDNVLQIDLPQYY